MGDPKSFAADLLEKLYVELAKFPDVATKNDHYLALSYAVRDRLLHRWVDSFRSVMQHKHRTVVYLSAEYLIGPQLGSNPGTRARRDRPRSHETSRRLASGADATCPERATGVVVAALFVAVAALLVRHLLGDAALGWVTTAALLALVWQAMPLLRQGGGFYRVSGALVLLGGTLAGGWWLLARRS